jgi:hypothetical protein
MSALLAVIAAGALFGGIMLFWRHAQNGLFAPPFAYHRDAALYVWTEVYGQPASKLPRIFWVRITDKNRCAAGCFIGAKGCVGGEAMLDVDAVNVAWDESVHSQLASTSLTHELAHHARARQGGNGWVHDAAHASLTEIGTARLVTWEAVRG